MRIFFYKTKKAVSTGMGAHGSVCGDIRLLFFVSIYHLN